LSSKKLAGVISFCILEWQKRGGSKAKSIHPNYIRGAPNTPWDGVWGGGGKNLLGKKNL